jgi:hypothetical protein
MSHVEKSELFEAFGGATDKIDVRDVKHILASLRKSTGSFEVDWHWFVVLKNGTFAYIAGGHEYSGWGYGTPEVYRANTKEECFNLVPQDLRWVWKDILNINEEIL